MMLCMPRPCLEKLVSLLELGLLCKLIFEARSIEAQICSGSVHVLFAFYKHVQWRQGLNGSTCASSSGTHG